MKLLKLSAPWCGPCKILSGVLYHSTHALTKDVQEVDVDTTEGREVAIKFGVRGVPTLIVLDDEGQEVRRKVGAVGGQDLEDFLNGV